MIAHHRDLSLIPIEVRPHVGAALTAGLSDEPRLERAPYATKRKAEAMAA
jgi:hypothetical protein